MPRRRAPHRRRPAGPVSASPARMVETGTDGLAYEVSAMPGARAVKDYRCPGCDHEIRSGTAHLVVWIADGDGDDRRHWHRPCWANRHNRGPSRRWS